mgnify:CR=1 FL=1
MVEARDARAAADQAELLYHNGLIKWEELNPIIQEYRRLDFKLRAESKKHQRNVEKELKAKYGHAYHR